MNILSTIKSFFTDKIGIVTKSALEKLREDLRENIANNIEDFCHEKLDVLVKQAISNLNIENKACTEKIQALSTRIDELETRLTELEQTASRKRSYKKKVEEATEEK